MADFAAKRLGAALDLSLIQAYSNFHGLMLRGKNNRAGSFRAKIELGGFVGLPDAKWGERAHAVSVPQEGTLLKETNFPIGPGIGWPDANAGISFFLAESELPRKATGKIVRRDLKAWFLPLERVKRSSWEGLESSIAPLKVPRRCIA